MIEVRENIIGISYQNAIQDFLLNENLPWFYNHKTHSYLDYYSQRLNGDTFQFICPLIRKDVNFVSEYLNFFKPLFLNAQDSFGVEIVDVSRAKINMSFKTGNSCIALPPHVDTSAKKFVSMVYYPFDCDGDTIVYDETSDTLNESLTPEVIRSVCKSKVVRSMKPKKGSAIMFDSNIYHSASTPCLYERRMVINCVFQIK